MNEIHVQVYIREASAKPHIASEEINAYLQQKTFDFLKKLNNVLKRRNLKGRVHTNAWPYPRSDKTIASDTDFNYNYLDDPKHNADVTVCAVPSVEDIDGAVGKLLLRNEPILHLCLLTAEALPEYEDAPDLYRGILAVPTGIRKESKNRFFEPLSVRNNDGSISIPTVVDSRTMTINAFNKMTLKHMENIIDLVHFQKSA